MLLSTLCWPFVSEVIAETIAQKAYFSEDLSLKDLLKDAFTARQ